MSAFAEVISMIEDAYFDDESDLSDDLADVIDNVDDAQSRLDAAWQLRKTVKGIAEVTKRIVEMLDDDIARMLGPIGVARLDDYCVRVKPKQTLRCIDVAGLREWLADDAFAAFNPNSARTTYLRKVAETRGEDADAALDSFFEKTIKEDALATIPIDRAPAYVRDMKHADTRDAAFLLER